MSLKGVGINFSYSNGRKILTDVDIEIKAGEIVGLHGYSGSGKTTLGKILAGYIKIKTGKIEIDGEILSKKNRKFNPVQIIHQHPEKSVNPKWNVNKILSEVDIDVKELMEIFEIKKEWLKRMPFELSGGELQRICIARVFDRRTKYIIADEITTMLDGINQAEIWKKILFLIKKRNIGLIIISHDYDLLKKLCNRIVEFSSL